MLVMSPPAHNTILLGTAPHCCLFWCDFQPRLMSLPNLCLRVVRLDWGGGGGWVGGSVACGWVG